MKAFEGWWNEEQSDEGFELECGEIDSIEDYIERLARVSWRAALEWVISKNNKDAIWIGDDTHNNTYDIILTDVIRQELEN